MGSSVKRDLKHLLSTVSCQLIKSHKWNPILHFSTEDKTLDRQFYVNLALNNWLNRHSEKAQASLVSVFTKFKDELQLDPYELLFEARRIQSVDRIISALSRFYSRLIALGLTEESAKQYCIVVRGFFLANRIALPKERRIAATPIAFIFDNA